MRRIRSTCQINSIHDWLTNENENTKQSQISSKLWINYRIQGCQTKTYREINEILINQVKCTPVEKIERNEDVKNLIKLQSGMKKRHLYMKANQYVIKTVIISLI